MLTICINKQKNLCAESKFQVALGGVTVKNWSKKLVE